MCLSKRILKALLFVISFSLILGGPTGKNCDGQDGLVDVGGYKLQYQEYSKGKPAVVFLNGGSATMDYWDEITKEIPKITKVITYERAGHQESEMGREPRDGLNIAGELKTLLEKLEIPEPYILVAHSAGCMYARIFASKYPDAVSGLILLDPGDKDVLDAFGEQHLKGKNKAQWADYWVQTWAGLAERPDGFGKEIQMKETTIEQMLSSEFRPELMLYVVSGLDESRPHYYIKDYGDKITKQFYSYIQEYHKSLIEDQPKGKYIPLHDAGHMIHHDRPDIVISLIESMFDSLKIENE